MSTISKMETPTGQEETAILLEEQSRRIATLQKSLTQAGRIHPNEAVILQEIKRGGDGMTAWQLQHTPYESEIDIVSDGRVIATVEAGEDKEKVAQMIVSAPDMLEALNNIIEHCEYERYPSCGEILRIAKYALKGLQ